MLVHSLHHPFWQQRQKFEYSQNDKFVFLVSVSIEKNWLCHICWIVWRMTSTNIIMFENSFLHFSSRSHTVTHTIVWLFGCDAAYWLLYKSQMCASMTSRQLSSSPSSSSPSSSSTETAYITYTPTSTTHRKTMEFRLNFVKVLFCFGLLSALLYFFLYDEFWSERRIRLLFLN